jgi:ABC-type transport system involved in cytochrome c biogenesis permease component
MEWIRRTLRLQVRESHVELALVFCLLMLSAMSIALAWQAQIIANQREAIRWLAHLRLGG